MKLIALMALVFSTCAFAARDVLPENNFCSPIVDSKRYITTTFDGYPREVKFACKYICKANNKSETIEAISKVTVRSMDEDALNVVCQGVLLKKVSWGYDFDRVQPFYAYKSEMQEIKKWAFLNVDQNNATEKEYLTILKGELNQVASSFIVAGLNGGAQTSYFKEAGNELSAIAQQLPENTTLLDHYIRQIVTSKGEIKKESSADSLILMMLKSNAAWRVPLQ